MFREMRRKNQLLSFEESVAVLNRGTSGVLALSGDHDYPYAVPLSYVYSDSKIYFHCAKSGHKLDAIRKNAKASFCVIDQDEVVPEKFTTYFRSVLVFGQMQILDKKEEKRHALRLLTAKYSPNQGQDGAEEIEKQLENVCVLALSMEHMTGKEAIEVVRSKNRQHGEDM